MAVRNTGSAARWILPLILLLIIVGIIGWVLFRQRLTGSTSPTPTPAVTVVTASPAPGSTPISGAATPVPGGAVPPSATPGGPRISTPAPGATAPPTVAGLQLGMITYRSSYVANIQHQADAGNAAYQFYLDPIQVTEKTLPHYGFTGGFTVVSPATASPSPTPYMGHDKRPTVKAVVRYEGHTYDVFLKQPAAQGPKGIWLIVTITQAAR